MRKRHSVVLCGCEGGLSECQTQIELVPFMPLNTDTTGVLGLLFLSPSLQSLLLLLLLLEFAWHISRSIRLVLSQSQQVCICMLFHAYFLECQALVVLQCTGGPFPA